MRLHDEGENARKTQGATSGLVPDGRVHLDAGQKSIGPF
jgi:hypothetical protein